MLQRPMLENSLRFTELHRGPVLRERGLIHLRAWEPDFRCTLVEQPIDGPLPADVHTVRTLPWAGDVSGALLAQGFRRRGRLRYLRLQGAFPFEAAGLRLRPAADLAELAAFSEVQARGFMLPGESFADWFQLLDASNRRNFEDASQRFWIGWWGERAASVAHVLTTGEVAGLYAVTTLSPFRRRGLSRAVLGAAIADARARGAAVVTLQVFADTPAEALYRKLGFVVEFDSEVWTRT